jgi:hypothetical protein
MRRVLVILFFVPFLGVAFLRFLLSRFRKMPPESHPESLAYDGMSAELSGTITPLFLDRALVRSLLPDALALVEKDIDPTWPGGENMHPVLLVTGKVRTGKRLRIGSQYRTAQLFNPFLESYVAVPFVRARAFDHPSPCLHFAKIYCQAFWPTELGVLCVGWPKTQCPMEMSSTAPGHSYSVKNPEDGNPWLSLQTVVDEQGASPLAANDVCLASVREMLSQPMIVLKGAKHQINSFDFRFEAAEITPVAASGVLHPGALNHGNEAISFQAPPITDSPFGAFHISTTYMNRVVEVLKP